MITPFPAATGPLLITADLPSPYRLEVISTTRAFHGIFGRDRSSVAHGLRSLLHLAPEAPVYLGGQTHGNAVYDVNSPHDRIEHQNYTLVKECDGLATKRLNQAVVVRTADCLPLVFSSSSQPWVAAVHAGWRGTLAGITKKTIDLAKESGVGVKDLHLWIGPHISGGVYEVSAELASEFQSKFGQLGRVAEGRLLHLARANSLLAEANGVPEENIRVCEHCTFSEPDMFPSYRRDGECRGQIYTVAVLRNN